MKKTLIVVAMATFVSTGAMAKSTPQHNAPKPQNGHIVHMVNKNTPKLAPRANHVNMHQPEHHRPAPVVAYVRPTPPPPAHHHSNNSGAILLGDALIAFAILASNAM